MKQPQTKGRMPESSRQATIRVKNLRLRTFIGFNPEEKANKQDVVVNFKIAYRITPEVLEDSVEDALNCKTITKQVISHVESGQLEKAS